MSASSVRRYDEALDKANRAVVRATLCQPCDTCSFVAPVSSQRLRRVGGA